MTFPIEELDARSHLLSLLYEPPRRVTDGLPLPTRGLIPDIEPEKEGRASARGETPER